MIITNIFILSFTLSINHLLPTHTCEFPQWLLKTDDIIDIDNNNHRHPPTTTSTTSTTTTSNNKRHWQGKVKEQLTEFSLMVEVARKTFRLWSVDATGDVDGFVSVTRVCATRISTAPAPNASDSNRRRYHYQGRRPSDRKTVDRRSDKFLVVHEEVDQTSLRFSCIQFLRRGRDAFQLKSSSDPGVEMNRDVLCSDGNMKVDPWLFVDRKNFGSYEGQIGWFGVKGDDSRTLLELQMNIRRKLL